jgi:hypothetical protein
VQVTLGDIMAHVVVKIGKSQVESVITRRSAEVPGLRRETRSRRNQVDGGDASKGLVLRYFEAVDLSTPGHGSLHRGSWSNSWSVSDPRNSIKSRFSPSVRRKGRRICDLFG